MSEYIIFDIETGPEPLEILAKQMPEFDAPGSIKDPEKIKAAIREKQQNWKERAALSPLSGRVLAIGYMLADDHFDIVDCSGDEGEGIANFWRMISTSLETHETKIIGFNSNWFDLPFLVRRSLLHGIKVPKLLRNGRYWSDICVDLMDVWTLGNREERISLDSLCKFLGIGQKSGSGADFAKLWETDRPKAMAYLRNDLTLTRDLARRLGFA